MPPPNNKAKHLRGARSNALIPKHMHTTSNHTKERRRDAWAAMSDIVKENSDIMMNTKVRVQTLEGNKVFLILLYHDLEIALEQCTSDVDLYGTGLTEKKLFRQTSNALQVNWKEVR